MWRGGRSRRFPSGHRVKGRPRLCRLSRPEGQAYGQLDRVSAFSHSALHSRGDEGAGDGVLNVAPRLLRFRAVRRTRSIGRERSGNLFVSQALGFPALFHEKPDSDLDSDSDTDTEHLTSHLSGVVTGCADGRGGRPPNAAGPEGSALGQRPSRPAGSALPEGTHAESCWAGLGRSCQALARQSQPRTLG